MKEKCSLWCYSKYWLSEKQRTPWLPALSHLELILFELKQIWMVRAEQECAAAGVGVGVGDFLGAATPATDWDTHFKCLHTHSTHKELPENIKAPRAEILMKTHFHCSCFVKSKMAEMEILFLWLLKLYSFQKCIVFILSTKILLKLKFKYGEPHYKENPHWLTLIKESDESKQGTAVFSLWLTLATRGLGMFSWPRKTPAWFNRH